MSRLFTKIGILFIGIVMLTFTSCREKYPDDGYFVVGGKTYNINEASLESVGYDDGYYQLRLKMDNTDNNDFHCLTFLLYSEVNQYLPSGVYTPYKYLDYDHKFKRGAWYAGEEEMAAIWVGKLKITNNNDTYTIDVDCEDSNGLGVAAKYKGELKVVY